MMSGPSSCEGVAAADHDECCLAYGVSGGEVGAKDEG
jgi:hypothetical protein